MNGFLSINKALHWTSHDVVQKARKILNIKKIGHLGTLDPLATGVLVLAIGSATKFIEYLLDNEKEYNAEIILGEKTETYDAEGEKIKVTDRPVDLEEIKKVIKNNFIGDIDQLPPKFSAKKINGETAYKKARRGDDFQMKSKKITIYNIEIIEYKWPILKIHVHCGTGTYIRSIAFDIGEKLGCGGYLNKLIRTRVRNFYIDTAFDINEISAEKILPIKSVLPDFPKTELTEIQIEKIKNGQTIQAKNSWEDGALILGIKDHQVISIMVYNKEDQTLKSKKLIIN